MAEMITVYEPYTQINPETGKWYRTWQLSKGYPLTGNIIGFGPSEDLKFPRFDFESARWVEDIHQLNQYLMQENDALKNRLDLVQDVVLELAAITL